MIFTTQISAKVYIKFHPEYIYKDPRQITKKKNSIGNNEHFIKAFSIWPINKSKGAQLH